MSDPSTTTAHIEGCLKRLESGDKAARDELLSIACDRMLRLTRKMLRDFDGVRRWEQTDDVFQNAVVRLLRALDEERPENARKFFGLVALQVRRELVDMARHYYGPQGLGEHHQSQPAIEAGDGAHESPMHDAGQLTQDPARLAEWADFHACVGKLDPEDREVFEMRFYIGLLEEQIAEMLSISDRTVKRRWQSARLRLHDLMGGHEPPM